MYKYYLSLGSNLGNTKQNIDNAIDIISQQKNIKLVKVAPYYFTHPLLPPNADESYYKMFCNTCIEIETNLKPQDLIKLTKNIEIKMCREKQHKYWSPRIIDIDIVYCELNEKSLFISTKNLTIPHKELFHRSFVLDPITYLKSTLKINNKSILSQSKKHSKHQPVLMGIVNITDNSFSGDGILPANKKAILQIKNKIIQLIDNAIPIIDIGCEATNPNSKPLTYQEEIDRLKPVIKIIKDIKKRTNTYSTRFSIDTYHTETAEFCIKNGFQIINDVNGFKNEQMWYLMQKYPHIEGIIMHSLTPHTDKNIVLDKNCDVIEILNKWTNDIVKKAKKYNISKDRIILDYGIGFGKTSWQSLQILQNINKINNHSCRVLVGHSKKSFMQLFEYNKNNNIYNQSLDRTFETIGISLFLQHLGVDILRVHDAVELQKAIINYHFT